MADAMLRNRPDVRERLQTAGAVLAVFAEGENNCDLDYFSDLRGRYDINGNLQCEVGGLGGVPGRPASSCGELNALSAMYNDPFLRGSTHGQNICVHEIAHLFMNVGLSDSERRQILQRYEQIQRRPDAWLTTAGNEMFALINHQEFWAEMSMIYFNGSPRVPTWNHVGISGPDALKHHDRQTYNLLHGIYRGSADLR